MTSCTAPLPPQCTFTVVSCMKRHIHRVHVFESLAFSVPTVGFSFSCTVYPTVLFLYCQLPYTTQDYTPPKTNFRLDFILKYDIGGHRQRQWCLWHHLGELFPWIRRRSAVAFHPLWKIGKSRGCGIFTLPGLQSRFKDKLLIIIWVVCPQE